MRHFVAFFMIALSLSLSAQNFNSNMSYRISSAESQYEGAVYLSLWDGYYELNYRAMSSYDGYDMMFWRFEKSGNYWTIQNEAEKKYLTYTKRAYTYNYGYSTYTDYSDELSVVDKVENDSSKWIIEAEENGYTIRNAAAPNLYVHVSAERYTQGTTDYMYGFVFIDQFYEGKSDVYLTFFDTYGEELASGSSAKSVVNALRVNGKRLVLDKTSQTYLLPVSQTNMGAKTFVGNVTFEGLEGEITYQLMVDGAVNQSKRFAVKNFSAGAPLTFTLKGSDGSEVGPYTMSLTFMPVIEVNVGSVNSNDYTKGSFRVNDGNTTEEDTSFTAAFKYRGASAQRYAKKSFNVKLFEQDGVTDLDANLLGLRNDHTWILDAMAIDRVRMRNRVCFDVWNEIDKLPYSSNYNQRNGTVGKFVEVILNGRYHGIYCFTDKINRKLLNLTKVLEDSTSGQATYTQRGLLYKGKQWGNDVYLKSIGGTPPLASVTWGNWELMYPDDHPTQEAWIPLRNLINYNNRSDSAFCATFADHYYFDNVLHYVMLQLAYNLQDNGMKNMYLSTKNIQKFGQCMLFTVWDMDSSLGGYWDGNYHNVVADTTYVTRVLPLSKLFSRNLLGFRDSLRAYWHEHKDVEFSYDSLMSKMNAYKDLFVLSGAWQREVNLWSEYATSYTMPKLQELADEVDYVGEWYKRNIAYLNRILPEPEPKDPDITAIQTLQTGKAVDAIYTIDGRRLENVTLRQLPHGIYIINGKKIVK